MMPVGAVVVKVPPHVATELLANVRPVGIVSVKATPPSAAGLPAGFVIVKVRDAVPLTLTAVGLNTLAIAGGATTRIVAGPAPPVPPFIELTVPEASVSVPKAMPVTFTENVHEPLGASEDDA